jgi:hypothetical protein
VNMTDYIGATGAAFKRLSYVFERIGHTPPATEFDGAEGNYVANIVNQYQTDLSRNEVLKIIDCARQPMWNLKGVLELMEPQEAEDYVLDRRRLQF